MSTAEILESIANQWERSFLRQLRRIDPGLVLEYEQLQTVRQAIHIVRSKGGVLSATPIQPKGATLADEVRAAARSFNGEGFKAADICKIISEQNPTLTGFRFRQKISATVSNLVKNQEFHRVKLGHCQGVRYFVNKEAVHDSTP